MAYCPIFYILLETDKYFHSPQEIRIFNVTYEKMTVKSQFL